MTSGIGLGNSVGAVSGQLSAAGKPQIGNGTPPPMKTLIYSPAARIIIADGNRQYDVSGDLVNGGVLRPENAVASLQFTLNNKNLRYNGLFDRMDRVILFLKRIKTIQVFSGYLDDVPYLQLYPGTVTFRASCTMKRLLHTWWDPTTQGSQALFSGSTAGEVEGDGTTTPGQKPIGSILRDLLIGVGGWDANQIHIQDFPQQMLTLVQQWMTTNQASTQASVDSFRQLMLGDDHSMGVGAAASANPALTLGPTAAGAPSYIATMINVTDAMGLGPTTDDLQLSQQVSQAAETLTGSRDAATQEAGKALQASSQNWNSQYRNVDAAILAMACAMTESNMRILANPAVPESYNYYHDGDGTNGTSLGLYQQISGGQWGDVAQRMNAEASTRGFLLALSRIDWKNMDPGAAIQAVQQSAFPGSYGQYVQPATLAVQAARAAIPDPTTVTYGAASAPLSPAQVIGNTSGITSMIPGLGTPGASGSTPTSAGALLGASKPNPDAMGAIACGMTLIGSPYDQIRPPVPGVGIDCSALTMLAYRGIGRDIGGNTGAQINAGIGVTAAQIKPGDLVFPSGMEHVVMYLGTGYPGAGGAAMALESSGTGWHQGSGPVPDGPMIKPFKYNLATVKAIRHIADFGGWDPTATYTNPVLAGPGTAPSTFGTSSVGTGYSATTAGGSGSEPIARNLFTYQFNYPFFAPKIDALFTGERSLINCDPLITMVQALCKATLRNWCSSPTGDFVAWYPDYWGLNGTQAVMNIQDIEMKDVSINLNDYSLITHAYVAMGQGGGQSMGPEGWLESGVASVENEALYQQMIKIAPGLQTPMTGHDILTKFGARPFMQEYDMVQNSELRMLLAIHHFTEGWTNQFATNVSFTFMPELFPGMRINLVGHNLVVYVTSVQHSFDYAHGFTTQATITAPSVPNGVSQVNQAFTLAQSALQPFTDQVTTGWFG